MLTQLIGIRTTQPQLSVTNQVAKVQVVSKPADFSIESPKAQVSVQSSQGQLTIDSTQARQSMGYFTPMALSDDVTAYAKRQYDRGVADVVSAGDRLKNPSSNVIAQLAFERMFVDFNDRQFVLAFIPKTPPSVRYSPGNTDVSFTQSSPKVQIRSNEPMISVEPGSTSIDVTPGSIKTYLREPSTLDLTV